MMRVELIVMMFVALVLGGCAFEMDEPNLSEGVLSHPFGSMIGEAVYEGENPVDDFKVARYEAMGIQFNEQDLVAFFNEEVKSSDYDGYEIRVSGDDGIYVTKSGRFNYGEVEIESETGNWHMPSYTLGFIYPDDQVIYAKTIWTDEDLALFLERSSLVFEEAFLEYGLHVVLDEAALSDDEKLVTIKTLMADLTAIEGFQTLIGVYVYGGDLRGERIDFSMDDVLLTDWENFDGVTASGENILK